MLSINRADIQVCKGNFSTWWENKEGTMPLKQPRMKKLMREITRLQDTAREKNGWAATAEKRKIGADAPSDKPKNYRSFQGAKAERTMARVKAIEKRRDAAIAEKQQLLKNVERSDALPLSAALFSCGTAGGAARVHDFRRGRCLQARQSYHPRRRAHCAARPKRLREKQPLKAAVRAGDSAHRRALEGERPEDFPRQSECFLAMRERGRVSARQWRG